VQPPLPLAQPLALSARPEGQRTEADAELDAVLAELSLGGWRDQ